MCLFPRSPLINSLSEILVVPFSNNAFKKYFDSNSYGHTFSDVSDSGRIAPRMIKFNTLNDIHHFEEFFLFFAVLFWAQHDFIRFQSFSYFSFQSFIQHIILTFLKSTLNNSIIVYNLQTILPIRALPTRLRYYILG